MTNIEYHHKPVMCKQVINSLNITENSKIVDATFGRGGHSIEILCKLKEQGKIIAFDKDIEAINYAKENYHDTRLQLIHSSFINIDTELDKRQLTGSIDGVLMDLGVSSPQLDNAYRGFSFQKDGPLDMRMDTTRKQTVASYLASASKDEIANVLYTFGEEKKSRVIANAIKNAQKIQPITRTTQLVDIITSIIFTKKGKKHPATRSFQALRIFINNELVELEIILGKLIKCLKKGGRIVIISFHSLEDRIVKRFINKYSKPLQLPKNLPIINDNSNILLKSIGRYFPSEQEVIHNIRARSAVLRVAQKL